MAKKRKKTKLNPKRRVLTEMDTKRAKHKLEDIRDDLVRKEEELNARYDELKNKASIDALYAAYAIIFRTLKDKRGWRTESLRRLLSASNTTAASIAKGDISLQDIFQSLKDEDDITFEGIEYEERNEEK